MQNLTEKCQLKIKWPQIIIIIIIKSNNNSYKNNAILLTLLMKTQEMEKRLKNCETKLRVIS